MRSRGLLVVLVCLAFTGAPRAGDGAGFEFATSPSGAFTAAWRPSGTAGDVVPVNELFAIEVLLFEGRGRDKPLRGAKVQASAWMPEHMHGMHRQPESEETAPGRYLVRGMLLHMEGAWQLFLDVIAGAVSERVEFDLTLKGSRAAPAIDGFTADEVRAVLELSPLPALPPDPTNRVADDPRAARLGQFVFFDPRFSAVGTVSCSTCHQPEHAFTDGKQLADNEGAPPGRAAVPGAANHAGADPRPTLERHTPSLVNVAFNRWFFWDGRADSPWSQPLQPLEEPREHATTRLAIAHALHDDPGLKRAYEELFGPLPALADARRFPAKGKPGEPAYDAMEAADRRAVDSLFANVGKAIAAYERRLVARSSPFDEFVAGVRAGDLEKQRVLAPAAREGLRLFVGAARCILCHSGPTLSDREFHDNRVPTLDGGPRRDPGRHRGMAAVLADPFNGAGAFSDAPDGPARDKLQYLPRAAEHWSEFKTPSLRNVAVTAPYMHQGQLATLDDVLAYYNTLERAVPTHSPERTLIALHFAPEQLAALRAFLESLTDMKIDASLLERPPTPYIR
jgi:cytochrome c peroxidase